MEIKCDLVLLSWNNLNLLKDCVSSILNNTNIPSRLIIVDNGSSEKGLREYLKSLEGNEVIEVHVIMNPSNEGFARGMNKGMGFSDAPYVCLLNNDIIVTEGWLGEMIKVASESPSIGVVNPSSNNFGLRLEKGIALKEFARTLKVENGKWIEMNACVGFCMLIKREVVNKIGFLDEGYGYAYFEDTDFSRRAQSAGYKCAMAKGCYVYHAEGKSGKYLKSKDQQFRRNAEKFFKKWGKPLRVAYIVSGKDISSDEKIRQNVENELKAHSRIWIFRQQGVDLKGLPEHIDVMPNILSGSIFNLLAFWNIVKKKKRFDRIYASGRFLRTVLAPYSWIRGAEICGL